ARAVVGLVLRVDDPLDRGAADRARLPKTAVHGHAFPERGDLLRKAVARFFAQTVRPFGERQARGVVETRDLVAVEIRRHLYRRQPRTVKDLVGVSVADAA